MSNSQTRSARRPNDASANYQLRREDSLVLQSLEDVVRTAEDSTGFAAEGDRRTNQSAALIVIVRVVNQRIVAR
jgi:uncharacterized Ntn-hydrolase superfamily protein